MSTPLAEVVAGTDGDLTVVAVNGEVDLSNVHEVAGAIRRSTPPSKELLLDLAGVEYLDSAAIAMLDGLRGAGLVAHVIAPREGAAGRLLTMVELGLPLHHTRAGAAQALRARRSDGAE